MSGQHFAENAPTSEACQEQIPQPSNTDVPKIRIYPKCGSRKILFSLHYSGVESEKELEHGKKVVMPSVTAFPLYTVLQPPGRT